MSRGRRDECHREGSKVKTGLTVARQKEQLSRMYLKDGISRDQIAFSVSTSCTTRPHPPVVGDICSHLDLLQYFV